MEWKKDTTRGGEKAKKSSKLRGNNLKQHTEPAGICGKEKLRAMTHPPELNEIRTALMFSGRLCVDTSRSTATKNAFNFSLQRLSCIDQSIVSIPIANLNWIIQLSMISMLIDADDFISIFHFHLQRDIADVVIPIMIISFHKHSGYCRK